MENKLSITEFNPIKDRFIQIANEETFLKEASFAIQHLNRNSYLAGATKQSIQEAVLNICQVGLTLNPVAKLAYLVPRYINKQLICCLEPSYMGLVKLITDTGSVKNIYAHVVYEGDIFEQTLGTSPEIIHKPRLGLKSNPIAVYAIAILKDGSKQIEVMDISEIDEIKESSESYKAFKSGKSQGCIWEKNFGEMARKTVIRRLTKYLPKTEQWDKVHTAIDLDEQDYKVSYAQLDLIDELLKTSSISEEKKEFISRYLSTYTPEQASQLINELKGKQTDQIDSGRMYSQTAISKKISKIK